MDLINLITLTKKLNIPPVSNINCTYPCIQFSYNFSFCLKSDLDIVLKLKPHFK